MSDIWDIVPNPDTYLNHLPSEQATQFEVVRNVYIAVLGAAIWDVLVYIPDDIKIIRRSAGFLTTGCFLFSRIFAITYLLLWVVVATHLVRNCDAIQISIGILCLLTMSTTSFLFLRRVQAVYLGNRLICWVSWFLWAGTSVVVALLAVGTHSRHIPGTQYCMIYEVESYVSVTNFMPAVFDTLVFFAISYKIISTHINFGGKTNWATVVSGKTLPTLSRALLQGGQQYYLIAFLLNILSGAFEFTPSVPPLYRTLFTLPTVALTTSMACRVHRNMTKAFHDDGLRDLPIVSDLCFAGGSHAPDKTTTRHLDQSRFSMTGQLVEPTKHRVGGCHLDPERPLCKEISHSSGSTTPPNL